MIDMSSHHLIYTLTSSTKYTSHNKKTHDMDKPRANNVINHGVAYNSGNTNDASIHEDNCGS